MYVLHVTVLLYVDKDRPHARGAEEQGSGVFNRGYLNGLVQASAANTADQVEKA